MEIDMARVEALIEKTNYQKNKLITLLQDIQTEYNYLPREALTEVSKALRIPLIDIIGVATFYRAFSLEPRGKHTVKVCLGTACHVRGGPKILEECERKLDVAAGHTTEDKEFTLETVNCLGCCAIGPVVVVDEDYHAHVSIKKVAPIIKKYKQKKG
jgi:NADH:ubiquinone oxidoreductase subunit E